MKSSTKTSFKETEIGLIPEEWGVSELGDSLLLIIDHRGLTPKKLGGDWSSTGIQAISAMSIKDGRLVSLDESKFVDKELYKKWMPVELEANDVLLTSEAPLGEVYLIKENEKFCLSQRLFALRTKKDVLDPVYLFYFLRSPKGKQELHGRATGSVVTGIRQSELVKIEVDIPPIAEQQHISSILSSLDDKIELNRQISTNLEKMASTLFKRWFVDFEFPDEKGRPYKSSGGKMVETEIGEVPEGWSLVPFADTITVLSGGTPKTTEASYWDGDIPWFSVVDAPNDADVFVVDTEKKVTNAGIENSAAQILKEGTTIITARGTVGKIALVGVPMAMNQSCYGLRGKIDQYGFYTYFNTKTLISALQNSAHGSVFDTITRETFTGIDSVLPPADAVVLFGKTVKPLLEEIKNNLFELRSLSRLRDALLPRLMSGRIRTKV